MSLLRTSPDLKQLVADGYNVEIREGHLLIKDVPYVDSSRQVRRGILVSELTTAGDLTAAPGTHVAMFSGAFPCDSDGRPLERIRAGGGQRIAEDLVVDHMFSSKPVATGRYDDYFQKMTTYVAIISTPAQRIDPSATAKTFAVVELDEDESVFNYMDTASSRARINKATKKLEVGRVAIVGLGGTGSYLLDLVAKTPVREIHLFDGDDFLTHNAFRAPGAPSLTELRERPKKVAHFGAIYSRMRRGVVEHPYEIDDSNILELKNMDFIFVCIDSGDAKRPIVEALERFKAPFIDVGLGVDLVDDRLRGQLRVTTSTPDRRDHFRKRVSLGRSDVRDEYDANIQVADLNALNAALAVMRWKKWCGFYADYGNEYNSTFVTNTNAIINDDVA